jgi:hypothetical protein
MGNSADDKIVIMYGSSVEVRSLSSGANAKSGNDGRNSIKSFRLIKFDGWFYVGAQT